MKKEDIFCAIGEVKDQYVIEADEFKRKRTYPVRWIAAAACVVLLLTAGILLRGRMGERIPLSEASRNVKVSYISNVPGGLFFGGIGSSSSADLAWMTEEEIFGPIASVETTIVRGTVTGIENIVIDFNGEKEYRALATVEVEKVIRGDCEPGDVLTIKLPCPIGGGIAVEDTGVISRIRVGMEGIFMPRQYGEDEYWEQNGAVLLQKDVAGYGFWDGERFAFLQTEEGIVYARGSFTGMSEPATLDDVEEYIVRMID